MKVAFVLCLALSGILLAGFVASMHGCDDTYEIDGQGRLAVARRTSGGSGPPTVVMELRSWETELPEFKDVAPHLKPGDQLTHSRKTAGIPPVEVVMTTLAVTRDHRVIRIYQDRFVPYWATIMGVSGIPLLLWSLAALWRSLLPRRESGRP